MRKNFTAILHEAVIGYKIEGDCEKVTYKNPNGEPLVFQKNYNPDKLFKYVCKIIGVEVLARVILLVEEPASGKFVNITYEHGKLKAIELD